VAYRHVGNAEARIYGILLDSARRWGIEAADRYDRLRACAEISAAGHLARPSYAPRRTAQNGRSAARRADDSTI
jgi:hypothetical protein